MNLGRPIARDPDPDRQSVYTKRGCQRCATRTESGAHLSLGVAAKHGNRGGGATYARFAVYVQSSAGAVTVALPMRQPWRFEGLLDDGR
jgi:hypothetical protein